MYTKDGPLESSHPIYSNDRYISRISSRSVRPPHTAASVKRRLCKIEGFSAANTCTLYQSLTEQTALEDSASLLFPGTSGPGLSDCNPIALVFDTCPPDKRRSQAVGTPDLVNLPERDLEQRYVFYLMYDEDGEVLSKTSFGEDNPCLGRVSTLSIPPPHTVSSLKNHIVGSEQIWGYTVQVFEDEGGQSIKDNSDVIALFADTFPGFIEDQPIAIAYESQGVGTKTGQADPETFEKLKISTNTHARELAQLIVELEKALLDLTSKMQEESNEAQERELAQVRAELRKATLQLREAKSTFDRLKQDHDAHVFKVGASPAQLQALSERPSFTRKLKVIKAWSPPNPLWHTYNVGDIFYTDGIKKEKPDPNNQWNGYQAISSSGKLAFVDIKEVAFC